MGDSPGQSVKMVGIPMMCIHGTMMVAGDFCIKHRIMTQDRRDFLRAGTLAGASIIATGTTAGATPFPAKAHPSGSLPHRFLGSGRHRIEVSSLGLGCMGMSYHRSFIPDRESSIRLIRKAYDMGVTFFDTAEVYGPFINEELVGEAVRPFSDYFGQSRPLISE